MIGKEQVGRCLVLAVLGVSSMLGNGCGGASRNEIKGRWWGFNNTTTYRRGDVPGWTDNCPVKKPIFIPTTNLCWSPIDIYRGWSPGSQDGLLARQHFENYVAAPWGWVSCGQVVLDVGVSCFDSMQEIYWKIGSEGMFYTSNPSSAPWQRWLGPTGVGESSLCAENGSCYGDLNKKGVPKTVHVRGYYRSAPRSNPK
jgi:hypothetical protein